MVVKSDLKLIKSLRQKKYRTLHRLFVAEGEKLNQALLDSGSTPRWLVTTEENPMDAIEAESRYIPIKEMRKISSLKSPAKVLGVYPIPTPASPDFSDWVVVLDDVADPGNLGTIIRLCDWFGIEHLICSPDSVDCYNPKVVQATMGSIARVQVHYQNLQEVLTNSPLPVFGGFMEGNKLADTELPSKGILVMGSEAHGISPELSALILNKLCIEPYGEPVAESLNVAMATAILLQEIRRPPTQK